VNSKRDANETMWLPNAAATCCIPTHVPLSLRCPNAGSRAARPPLVLGGEAQPGWSTGGQLIRRVAKPERQCSCHPHPSTPAAHGPRALLPQAHRRYRRKLAPSGRAPPLQRRGGRSRSGGCCKRLLAAAAQPRSGPTAASELRFAYTAPCGPLAHAGCAPGLVTLHGAAR
jgi:hypothetical protein